MGFWARVSWTICPGWLWTAILLTSASWVPRSSQEPPAPGLNSCFEQRLFLAEQVPITARCPSFENCLLKATVVQVNLCSPCPKVPCPKCPLSKLANNKDCEPETQSISVRGRWVRNKTWADFLPSGLAYLILLSVAHPAAKENFALPSDFQVVLSLLWHPNILNSFLTS
jgi:hypothetical protein